MTANAVTDDQSRIKKPTPEEVDTYTRRESELRQRFLKGILDIPGVLALIQQALELVRTFINCNAKPETPSWADQENPIIEHKPGGTVDPARFATADVFKEGEDWLAGEEFVTRGQKLKGAMNACAFDFYAQPENWKYLPDDVDVIVFVNTVLRGSDGYHYVRYLYRVGLEWYRDYYWLGDRFDRHCRVAVLAS